MNKVIISGNLTKNPEIVKNGDTAISRFSIAVFDGFDKNDNEITSFFNVKCFSKTAEKSSEYQKGQKILLEGRIKQDKFIGKEGKNVDMTYIVAERIEPMFRKESNEQNRRNVEVAETKITQPQVATARTEEDDSEIPF